MNSVWTPRQEQLRHRFFEAGRDLVRPGAAARDAGQAFERDLWRRVAATGLFGLHLPCGLGGGGLSIEEAAAAFEGFAAGCEDIGFLVSIVSHMGLVQSVIHVMGSAAQQQRWLPGLIDGSVIGCFAVTEKHCGSDVRAMSMAAQPCADGGWKLNGAKWNITNAPVADLCIAFAKTAHRAGKPVTAFLVDLSLPGVIRSEPFDLMGNRTTPVGELVFNDLHVPDDALIGEPGRGLRVLDFAFVVERILTGIAMAGCTESLISMCLEWTDERRAFGRPIGDYQYVQGHVVEMYAGMELVRSTALRVLDSLIQRRDCAALASVVKMAAAEAFHTAAIGALRIFGNHGYRRGSAVERLCRDAAGILLAGGTSEIHKTIIWRKLQHRRLRRPAAPAANFQRNGECEPPKATF